MAAVLLAAVLTGCSSSDSTDATSSSTGSNGDGTTIKLSQLMFMPATTTIKVGTKVTWTNDETISHTVTSGEPTGVDMGTSLRSGEKPDGMFEKQLAKKGDSFSFTFDKAGTYPYYCDIHQGMNAEVVVTP